MSSWREIQRHNFTCWLKLAQFLNLNPSIFPTILKKGPFPLNLPLRLAEKIQKNNPKDPILLQFLPLQKELSEYDHFTKDPVGDIPSRLTNRLLKKYAQRALLLCSSSCAMHCRYCFRKNYDYQRQNNLYQEEMSLIQKDLSIKEIILSGGDPLSLSDSLLEHLIENLNQISHLKRLRIHTRFPVGIPERIDSSLLSVLEKTKLQVFFVVHINHFAELDSILFASLKKIQRMGIPVLSQTVLLHEINDNLSTLLQLFESLVNEGILPYYLHQLDKVEGSKHFESDVENGKKLILQLRERLSGYAVPRYILEESGHLSKTILI